MFAARNTEYNDLARSLGGNQAEIALVAQRLSRDTLQHILDNAPADEPAAQATLARLSGRLFTAEFGSAQHNDRDAFVDVFAELVSASQEFVRAANGGGGGERGACSLRDAAQCVRVLNWCGVRGSGNLDHASAGLAASSSAHQAAAASGAAPAWTSDDFFSVRPVAHSALRQATAMALSHCYMSRLDAAQRAGFCACIAERWTQLQRPLPTAAPAAGDRLEIQSWFRIELPSFGPMCSWLQLGDPHAVEAAFVSVCHLRPLTRI